MRPLAIVQARMGSTRLPGKMLLDLGGHPLIWWAWKASVDAFGADNVVVAMPASAENDELDTAVVSFGGNVFRWDGPENDVLGRLAACAKEYRPRQQQAMIIRVTPDDWRKSAGALRATASRNREYPVVLGGEACRKAELDYWNKELPANDSSREHLGHWLYEGYTHELPKHWSIDTFDDLEAAVDELGRAPT